MNGDDLRNRLKGNYSGRQPYRSSQPNRAPAPRPQVPDVPSSPKKSRKKLYFFIFTSILMSVGGLSAGWYFVLRENDPTPPSVKSSVSLPLYYPEKLPEGFNVDEKSYSVSGKIVTFHASNQQDDKIIFTIQPRPPTFDYQTFYQRGLSDTEQFTTAAGQAAIGKAQDKLVGNLVTDVSWVLVSSSKAEIPASDLKLVLNNLKRSN